MQRAMEPIQVTKLTIDEGNLSFTPSIFSWNNCDVAQTLDLTLEYTGRAPKALILFYENNY